jgi:dCMP deaminase
MLTEKDRRYLEWVEYGGKLFSTCSRRQYMALILGKDGRVVATGYNGAPPGMTHCVDGGCPRALEQAEGTGHGTGYDNCIAVHAEQNALLYSDRTARAGGTIYVNGPPCFGCAKEIANSGLRRIVYKADHNYTDIGRVTEFLQQAGIKVVAG